MLENYNRAPGPIECVNISTTSVTDKEILKKKINQTKDNAMNLELKSY